MCHVLLLMPVLGLPILWLMPLSLAVPIYVVLALGSGLLYWLIWKSMSRPLDTGVESLIGTEAEVVSKLSPGHRAQYLVRAGGELWTALCSDVLQSRENVNIEAVDGISLVVQPVGSTPHTDQSAGAEEKQARGKAKSCHLK